MRNVLALVAVLAFVTVSCEPPVQDDDVITRFNAELTLMGQIQERGTLHVGVEANFPPWSSVDASGNAQGFTEDLGRLIADSLGVDVEFTALPSSNMPVYVETGKLDIAFPVLPITEEVYRERGMSDPYFVAHQKLLVPRSSPITGLEDLDGKVVCSAITPPTETDIGVLNPAVKTVVRAVDRDGCLRPIAKGQVAAVTGPDILLLSYAARHPGLRVVGDELSTEGYGAMVGDSFGGFAEFVNSVLAEADRELYWNKLYERWVTPVTGEPSPPFPTMTLQEAAALFPSSAP
jgi:polar amino acid transport system substrate-binding protein